jgi:nicotinic acid phosphoribosyltransferase
MTLHLSSVAYTYLVGTSLANQIVYKLYAADGNTVIKTATDTITYVGTTETSRSRSFS